MDIQQYVKACKKLLDEFEAHWEQKYRWEHENYPADLPLTDWSDQYIKFLKEVHGKRREEK